MKLDKLLYFALFYLCAVPIISAQQSSEPMRATHAGFASAREGAELRNAPMMFEANQGQADSQIKYMSRGNGYSVSLTSGGLLLSLHSLPSSLSPSVEVDGASGSKHGRPQLSPIHQQEKLFRERQSSFVSIEFAGANTNPTMVGEEPLSTRINYFIGRDPRKWHRNVPTYGKIRYRDIYPGIDLIYYGNNHRVEYDFDLSPGADPEKIQLSVKGADELHIDSRGNLLLIKGGTTLLFQMPAIHQEVGGHKTKVDGAYMMVDATHVGFSVANYDKSKNLVIDPVLVYSTLLGGSDDNFASGVAVDSTGAAYVTGITDSPDFPLATLGSYSPNVFRMFIAKFDATGSNLLFADYFGGTTGTDDAYGVALDSAGNAYITGATASSDFPLVNAYQSVFSGSQDAFLVKFSADGSSIDYSTYLGGSNLTNIGGSYSQLGTSVTVDAAGEALVAGFTQATDFPMVNAFQPSVASDQFGNWGQYGFLTKFAADGASLVFSTYLAGSTYNVESCSGCFPSSLLLGIAADGMGNAYVTGMTNTVNFPVTSGALMTQSPAYPMLDVGFVAKFTSSGGISYSTYLGGFSGSFLEAIAADGNGSAYVTGYDFAGDGFPIISTGICDPYSVPCTGTVIAKLDPTGASLVYSTFLGTSNNMPGQAIQLDTSGDAFVVGSDLQFDLSNPIEQYSGYGDVVIAEIDATASNLLFATFLGGQGLDTAASSLAIDSSGAVYVVGATESVDFPVTQSAYQTISNGQNMAFVSKIDPNSSAPAIAMAPFSLQFGTQDVGTTSAPQTSILRNMGSATVVISNKNVSGDFAESDDCGGAVAAASLCTISVTFSPATSGVLSGALTISDNAQGAPHVLMLTGIGAGAPDIVAVNPSTLSFATQSLGTSSASQAVTFTNNGSTDVVISSVQVAGDFTETNICGTVPANGTCTVQVNFVPTASGTRTGLLQFTDSANGSPQAVTLSGTAADFMASAAGNGSATVAPGGTVSYSLNLSSIGASFSNAVTLSCGGAPAYSTCAVSPSTVVPGSSTTAATVTVTTSGATAAALGVFRKGRFLATGIYMPFAIFGFLLMGVRDRRVIRNIGAMLSTLLLALLIGCAGGTGTVQQRSPVASKTTPAGTYTLDIIASSGNLRHVTKLTLLVQ